MKNIHLGPTFPGFLSPNVAKVLVEKFGISGIGTVEEDIEIYGMKNIKTGIIKRMEQEEILSPLFILFFYCIKIISYYVFKKVSSKIIFPSITYIIREYIIFALVQHPNFKK